MLEDVSQNAVKLRHACALLALVSQFENNHLQYTDEEMKNIGD